MSLLIECYYYYSNRISNLVEAWKITYRNLVLKIVLVSTVLTDVKTCSVVLVYS